MFKCQPPVKLHKTCLWAQICCLLSVRKYVSKWIETKQRYSLAKVKISWLIWTLQHRSSVLNLPLFFKTWFNRRLSMNVNSNLANDNAFRDSVQFFQVDLSFARFELTSLIEGDILCKYIKNMFFTYFGHFGKNYIFWDFEHILTYFENFGNIFHIFLQNHMFVYKNWRKKMSKNLEFFFEKMRKLVKNFLQFNFVEDFFNTWKFCLKTLVISKGTQKVSKNGSP